MLIGGNSYTHTHPHITRSSRSQMFFKRYALKNFANFTGKHLHWSLFLIRLCFSVKFVNFLKTAFSTYRTSPVTASACLKYKNSQQRTTQHLYLSRTRATAFLFKTFVFFFLRNCQLWKKGTHLATKIR